MQKYLDNTEKRTLTEEQFDEAVAAWRGKVAPRTSGKVPGTRRCRKKHETWPELWAAQLDYTAIIVEKNRDKINQRYREKYHADPEAARARTKKKYYSNHKKTLERVKKYRDANKDVMYERTREWRKNNPDHLKTYAKKYNAENKEAIAKRNANWRKNNPEHMKMLRKRWGENNTQHVRDYARNYGGKKYAVDLQYKMKVLIRNRLNKAIVNNQKAGSAVRDLGCSIPELLDHLESQFNRRMTRDNWGTYWHIDHIYPLAAADLTDRVQFLAANNWQNLQPLTATANEKKNDKVTAAAKRLFKKLVKQFS